MASERRIAEIFKKTEGHCHFCGDRILLKKHAGSADSKGAWEIDHVIQRKKGGRNDIGNCLPACVRCNRLRWHRTGEGVRELLVYGLIARDEIKKNSTTGQTMQELKKKRVEDTRKRRQQLQENEKVKPSAAKLGRSVASPRGRGKVAR